MSTSKVEKLFSGMKARNKVLEQLPVRALTFIRGIAQNASIHHAMEAAGYTLAIQRQGFQLLESASGFAVSSSAAPTNPSRQAIQAVSDWYGSAFGRLHAALAHMHPAQSDFVFRGLQNVSGVASVVAAGLLLERLDDLAGTGPNADARKASAAEDKQAMTTLATRGFDAKELARVHALVDVAHDAAADEQPIDADEQEQRLLALKAWFDDWSETARSLFAKRADLIKIGLAHRHAPEDVTPAAPATPPVAAPPAPVAPATPAVMPTTPHA